MGEPTAGGSEGMSDQDLIEGTGANWATWLELLDAREASTMDQSAIMRLLIDEFEIDGWWARSIAIGYERERGRR